MRLPNNIHDDFEQRFAKQQDDFGKHFQATRRAAFVGMFVTFGIAATVLGFIGWVIVMVMRHFGIV